jgi:N-formylglutamate amidohydrolase
MTHAPAPRRLTRRSLLTGLPALGGLLPTAGGRAEAADAFDPESYVTAQAGDLPLLLCAAHGGTRELPGVPVRTGENLQPGSVGFVLLRDSNTEHLTPALAKAIAHRLGKQPYWVVLTAHRKFVDANRPPENAVEHPRARAVYDAFHARLAEYCRDIHRRFGGGLLLDVHGQARTRDVVYRGTQNGATMAQLIRRHGEGVHAGPQGFAGLLVAHGIRMEPTDTRREASGFTGGPIVRTYGAMAGMGAIQLEFGFDFRRMDAIPAVADRAADGIAAFLRRYLLPAPGKAPPTPAK